MAQAAHVRPDDGAMTLAPIDVFRAQHKRMGWLYRLLDVGYGVDLAVQDVARLSSRAAVGWSLGFDAAIMILFGLIWWRYDLSSTWNVLDPFGAGLVEAIPKGEWWAVLGGLIDILVRVIVTLAPSLIQFRMPHLAMRHDAAWLALWATAVFDMATDSVDVREDIPKFFGWLIDAASNAPASAWWSIIALCLVLLVLRWSQWPLWGAIGVLCGAILLFGTSVVGESGRTFAGDVVFWGNVGFWTLFASFAAQSLFFIQVAKVMMLAQKLRAQSA